MLFNECVGEKNITPESVVFLMVSIDHETPGGFRISICQSVLLAPAGKVKLSCFHFPHVEIQFFPGLLYLWRAH